ncbi:MAG TPA: M23 family metallopeptidase [Ignavibacteriaceae bacterium]|nr:M23 family metallopeptidase [Ignavibacteriaceae bacterium]
MHRVKKYWEKLKNLKSFSLAIIPDYSGVKAKSQKFSVKIIFIFVIAYSIIIFFLSYLIFSYTPVGTWMNVKGGSLTKEDLAIVDKLNDRMIFLARELEKTKSDNEKLRYAISLGDSSLIDSLRNLDSTNVNDNSPDLKGGGNIFAVIKKLFFEPKTVKLETGQLFSKPVNGFVSREFNPGKGHIGIDYVVKTGTPVYASGSGYVVFSDYTVKDGYMLIINLPGDYVMVYKHCSALLKKSREIVTEGELIALSGNTGEITTGPHLHFEIWKNGYPIDPKSVLINY